MKKFLAVILFALTAVVFGFGLSACGRSDDGKITVFMPDGAPALAMARFMAEDIDLGVNVIYKVVGSEEIASCVTYNDESKNADVVILPVNAASKLLGSGERYKMLGAVTHGNLFIVANGDKQILNEENFAESISGKKIGVVNLPAFPGALFNLLLIKYGVKDSVTLENIAATAVTGTSGEYDYFVIPEPAASTRIGNANLNLKNVGSLQQLYGANGYPQAVLLAKSSLIESNPKFIKNLMSEMIVNAEWLLKDEVSAQTIIDGISSHFADPENTAPTFNASNLTKPVISNCAIRFENCTVCKSNVTEILEKLKAAGDATATAVSDNFFYFGE